MTFSVVLSNLDDSKLFVYFMTILWHFMTFSRTRPGPKLLLCVFIFDKWVHAGSILYFIRTTTPVTWSSYRYWHWKQDLKKKSTVCILKTWRPTEIRPHACVRNSFKVSSFRISFVLLWLNFPFMILSG